MSNRIKVGLTEFNQASKRVAIFLILRDYKRIINNPSDFELIDRFDQDLSNQIWFLCLLYNAQVFSIASFEASLDQLISK